MAPMVSQPQQYFPCILPYLQTVQVTICHIHIIPRNMLQGAFALIAQKSNTIESTYSTRLFNFTVITIMKMQEVLQIMLCQFCQCFSVYCKVRKNHKLMIVELSGLLLCRISTA